MHPGQNESRDLDGLVKQLRITLKPRHLDFKNGGEVVSGPLPSAVTDAERKKVRDALIALIAQAELLMINRAACDRSIVNDAAMRWAEEQFLMRMDAKIVKARRVQERIERVNDEFEADEE